MKEYRIKALSAEHKRAIVGALRGVGTKGSAFDFEEIASGDWNIVGINDEGKIDGWIDSIQPTHTSLDSLLEDIEKDRRTVEINVAGVGIRVRAASGGLRVGEYGFTFEDFDRIAAAVKQVRGE